MKRVFAHIGFSVAITLVVASLLSTKILILSTIGLAILFIASLCLRCFRSNISIPLCLGASTFALVLFLTVTSLVVASQLERAGTSEDISFYVVDLEERNEYGEYIYTAKLTDGGKIRVKSDIPISAEYYTVINVKAKLYAIGDKPFNSYGYWSKGIFLSATLDKFSVTNGYVRSPMVHILHLRQEIMSAFDSLIGGDEAGVAIALITGNRDRISRLIQDYFRFSGATHIMAVSGLHLTVVAGSILLLLRKLRVPSSVVSPIAITIILSYIALAGFSKSVVRAGIMMIMMVIALLLRTYGDSLNSLGLAVFLICLNPFAVTDIGAMLSVLSTLAMIIAGREDFGVATTFESRADERLKARLVNRIVSVRLTIYVLIFTLPVLFIYFGYVNISSIISSLVVVPLGSLAMILALITFLFFKLHIGIGASLFAYLTKGLIHIIIAILRYISSFSASSLPLGNYFALVIIGVLVIIAVCFIYKNGVLLKQGIALSLVFAIAFSMFVYGYTKDYSYVYVTKNGASVIEHNGYTIVGGVRDKSDYYGIHSYLLSRNEDIDLLVDNGDVVSTVELTQAIHTNILLSDDLDSYILDVGCFDDIEIKNDYAIDFGDGFVLKYHYGEYSVSVDDVTIYCGKINNSSDIFIDTSTATITDRAGQINLDNGDIIYTIKDNGFSARRMKAWQE